LRRWYEIQCGGEAGSCPCVGGYLNPTWQTAYGPGTCTTQSSNSPLSMSPANGRFQIVSPPPGAPAGYALRVELRKGDLWPCPSGCGSTTTRNELVYSQDSNTPLPTRYYPGDERWFAWSTYFDSGFAGWTCDGSDANCPGGVPNA